jgi:hypothetical protein
MEPALVGVVTVTFSTTAETSAGMPLPVTFKSTWLLAATGPWTDPDLRPAHPVSGVDVVSRFMPHRVGGEALLLLPVERLVWAVVCVTSAVLPRPDGRVLLVSIAVSCGIQTVRLTGGEPLLNPHAAFPKCGRLVFDSHIVIELAGERRNPLLVGAGVNHLADLVVHAGVGGAVGAHTRDTGPSHRVLAIPYASGTNESNRRRDGQPSRTPNLPITNPLQ